MIDNEAPGTKAERERERARVRHYAATGDGVKCIPGEEEKDFFKDTTQKNVVIYVRVSTDDPMQIHSFELQKKYYEDFVTEHPHWNLLKIYSDYGKSGVSLDKRDAFNQMIADCLDNKNIHLVVVKSVSRFARNIVDCLATVRRLAELRKPIGVYFEMEKIYTLNSHYEMALNTFVTLAEQESKMKSDLLKDAYRKRSKYGIVWTPELLGYDLDNDGNLIIDEEEAKTVRLIYFMYLYGYTCATIAKKLMKLGCRTNRRNNEGEYNMKWSPGTVLMVLQNERHCGEILTQKTYTPSFRLHKAYKNRGKLPQYIKENHHEPIVSKDDFVAVQHLISNAKYGNKGFLPELKVIKEGALKGFVSLNPRWGAFHAEDYLAAAASVCNTEVGQTKRNPIEIKAQAGEFDFRGYEVVRAEYFDSMRKPCVSFAGNIMWFSLECIRKLGNVAYIEVLIDPTKQMLAVRPCAKEVRNAVKWSKTKNGKNMARTINGHAFLGTLYELFSWDACYRYRIGGVRIQKGNETVIIFDMHETEIFMSKDAFEHATTLCGTADTKMHPITVVANKVKVYPKAWFIGFGHEYYHRRGQVRELTTLHASNKWYLTAEGQPYRDEKSLNVTAPESLATGIKNIIKDIGGVENGDLT